MPYPSKEDRLLTMYDVIHILNPLDLDENIQLERLFSRDSKELAKRLTKLKPANANYQNMIWKKIENIVHRIITREKYKQYYTLMIESLIDGLENMQDNGAWLK